MALQRMEIAKKSEPPLDGPVKMEKNFDEMLFLGQKTNVDFELDSYSRSWVVFRLRSVHSGLFKVKPCSRGLLPPKDNQPLEITFVSHDPLAEGRLILEVAEVKKKNELRKTLQASDVWNDTKEDQITRLKLQFKRNEKLEEKESEKLKITLSGPEKSFSDKIQKIIGRIQRENLVKDLLLIAAVLFLLGILAGGFFTRSSQK